MRRATVTLTDDLEALLENHLARLETPPSLNVLMQAALRSYLAGLGPGARRRPKGEASMIAEKAKDSEAGPPGTIELDLETERALRAAAAREGMTASALAAAVLRQYARGVGRPAPRGIGAYRSGRSDVSTRAEDLLRSAARKTRR
jgi:hypothetical protein